MGFKIPLYKRYVDDILIALRSINPGWGYDKKSDKMVYREDQSQDQRHQDQRTFDVLQEIANTLDPNIQMATDAPSRNSDGRLPVLNL